MTLPVKLRDIVDHLEMVGDEVTVWINRRTGELALITPEDEAMIERDEPPAADWQKDVLEQARMVLNSDHYIQLPDHIEIDEYAIMERFCNSLEDDRLKNSLQHAVEGKGAFRRFKDGVYKSGIEKDWFAFKEQTFKKLTIAFLQKERIAFVDE